MLLKNLFPYTCSLCAAPSDRHFDLCTGCKHDLPYIHHACLQCASILSDDLICGACISTPPPQDKTIALCQYEFPVDHMITSLKFQRKLHFGFILGSLLATKIKDHYQHEPLPELLIPMPLHTIRLRERGYNQALEIARPLHTTLNIPILNDHCHRIRNTKPQTLIESKKRSKNIKGAFEITKDINAKHVAIIDDVVTTGITAGELCRQLKRAGIEQVDVWCCARTQESGN